MAYEKNRRTQEQSPPKEQHWEIVTDYRGEIVGGERSSANTLYITVRTGPKNKPVDTKYALRNHTKPRETINGHTNVSGTVGYFCRLTDRKVEGDLTPVDPDYLKNRLLKKVAEAEMKGLLKKRDEEVTQKKNFKILARLGELDKLDNYKPRHRR